jgi:hypothetical protein
MQGSLFLRTYYLTTKTNTEMNAHTSKRQMPAQADHDNDSSIGSASSPSTSHGDLESTSHNTKDGADDDLRRKIIDEEDRNVKRARILVGIAFLLCAAAVTTAVYLFAKQSEQEAFENEVSHPK